MGDAVRAIAYDESGEEVAYDGYQEMKNAKLTQQRDERLEADERAECQEREVRRLANVAANAENQLSDALNQRDQLLAVLEEISNLPSYRQDECSEIARDAIAKAKGIDHE